MKIEIRNSCSDFNSYRANRVKSLFNPERGDAFTLDAEIPGSNEDWQIGVVVGPSGTGKSSIGRAIGGGITDLYEGWPEDAPIVDAIAPDGDFNVVTGSLAAVGLGDVPAWLRPFKALSNGQQFRAGLARCLCDPPEMLVVDEFTSVIDRQIAKIGALAFSKSWRRLKGKRVVLLSCHYDILDWIEPDWVFDTGRGELTKKAGLASRGNAPASSWKSGRSTQVIGQCLSRITI
jgi:energy-coupling factor transporter ATP-binding protein EcfA2